MKLSSDLIQAIGTIAAALAALIALFVAWDQGRVMRAQQHASVMPILAASVSLNHTDEQFELVVAVRNDGVGPAFVESVRILSGGEPMQTMAQFQETVLPEAFHEFASFNGGTLRGALGAGREQRLISFFWDETEENSQALQVLLGALVADPAHMQVETCYCSVFHQCWMAQPGEGARAEPIRTCPNAGDDVFAQWSASRTEQATP